MFLQARPHHIMRQGGLQHIIIWAMEAATNYNVKLHPEVISDITRERERERERERVSFIELEARAHVSRRLQLFGSRGWFALLATQTTVLDWIQYQK